MRLDEPKSSTLRIIDAIGQLTAPQNIATSAIAAAKPAGMPSTGPSTQPSVAPMKKVGTISPPLKPKPMVTAVKTIRDSYHLRADAVVVVAAGELCQYNEHNAADRTSQVGIFYLRRRKPLGLVHRDAENYAHHGADDCKETGTKYHPDLQRLEDHVKAHGCNADEP